MRKVLAVSTLAVALCACGHSGGATSVRRGDVVTLLPRGGLVVNAYTLGYQTCGLVGEQHLSAEVHASSSDPQVLAGDFAMIDFTGRARPSAARGCLDALEGRSPAPRP